MLQNEPDLWYDSKRKKYVLIIWEVDPNGKKYRRRISTRTDNKQIAKQYRAGWLIQQAEQGSKVANPHSMSSALYEAFRSKQENKVLNKKSSKETERAIRLFLDFIRKETNDVHFPIQRITFEQCNSFLRSIKHDRQRNKHRTNLLALWNTLIDYRETYGILENPFARTKAIKLPEREPEQISDSEFQKLFDGMRVDTFQMRITRLACAFSRYTGARLAEICYIRTKNTEGCNIEIRNHEEFTTKNKRNRDVPITDIVRRILQEISILKSEHESVYVRESEYLFCNEKGNVFDGDGAYISKYFHENKTAILPNRTKLTFHSLRRSYGQELLSEHVPVAMVSYLLGHRSITTTEKSYANARNIPLESIREKVNAIHSHSHVMQQKKIDTPLLKEATFRTGDRA